MTQKVALYSRVSTQNQDLERQEEKLTEWAKSKGYDYDLFSEKVSSVSERPKFEEIINNLDKYDKFVVTKIDRFARSILDLIERIQYLKDNDTEFAAIDQPINTEDELYGDFMLKLLGLFAEFERKMIRRRMEEGFEEAREEGRVGRPKKDIPEEKLGKMYKRGASYKFMASEFDVSVSTVKRRLKEYGII